MFDEEFLKALQSCELPEREFGHAAHVRAAYLYLQQSDFAGALQRIRRAIRNYATHCGKPDRYHETITVAYVALVQQYIYEHGNGNGNGSNGGGWAAFARDNSQLFQPGLLEQFYPRAQLESDMARRVFLLPRSVLTPSSREGGEGRPSYRTTA
jgi:hypothetical protein